MTQEKTSEQEVKKQERFPDYIYMSAFDLVRSPELILKAGTFNSHKKSTLCVSKGVDRKMIPLFLA